MTAKKMTKKTTSAIEILRDHVGQDAELENLVREEQIKFDIGCLIRELREDSGLTQAQLAEIVGTSQAQISRTEDADYEGSKLATIVSIAEALQETMTIVIGSRATTFVPLHEVEKRPSCLRTTRMAARSKRSVRGKKGGGKVPSH